MNKLGLAFVLILVLNLSIFLAEAIPFSKPLIKKTKSGGVVERADAPEECREMFETCTPSEECCGDLMCMKSFFDGVFICQELLL
ncbi:hypothetical protein TNIN_166591 [Trichonephila inaurata madagascariensis]|uniref:Uncharacterized protein n=1 Tax=Trichonephila inaurata madagascariensis TaxID=2747483 RepID=A0A8X6J6P9_9ARAC|nr:hypothetical protein TNIN_166591 [Trichonephila inaurata madagascariensis]